MQKQYLKIPKAIEACRAYELKPVKSNVIPLRILQEKTRQRLESMLMSYKIESTLS